MDTVFIKGMIFRGIHGLTQKEHASKQAFSVSIEADVKTLSQAAETDDITKTVDYRMIRDIVQKTIEESMHRNLIETLGTLIAYEVMRSLPTIEEVRVTVEKPEIWKNSCPGVTIRCRRDKDKKGAQ